MKQKINQTIRKKQSAFTLVELSIVLVIIGLIVSGVLVGKDMIEAARIRSTTSDLLTLQSTFVAFDLKYNAIPGDMPNAYDFFGDDCGTNTYTAYTGCNGDDSGDVDSSERLWRHLDLSDLFPNNLDYARQAIATNIQDDIGIVVFNDAYPAGITVASGMNFSLAGDGAAGWFYGKLTNVYAWQLDNKIDDGVANKGIFITNSGHLPSENCISGVFSDPSYDYDLSSTASTCRTHFYFE